MKDNAAKPAAPHRRIRPAEVASWALIVGAVVLGWQVVLQPLIQRAPVDAAIRLAPNSPLVLRRAAEAELIAGRNDNAASLGRDALARAPFDVRALRVVGLTEARAGREDQADDILTLAGNWSLRDDPAHAWLVERRLRVGDYASSFAHADTLVRRRKDMQTQVFRLFAVAATQDPQRSMPVIANLLEASPPWRQDFLIHLNGSPEGLQAAASLAILLRESEAPFTRPELRRLYAQLLQRNAIDALRTIRSRLNPSTASGALSNGGFADPSDPEPFQWRLAQQAGVTAEIVPDDLSPGNPALRIDYDGYSAAGQVASQLILLRPGPHRLEYAVRAEEGDAAARLVWTVNCTKPGRTIASVPSARSEGTGWTRMTTRFDVPEGCQALWLRLEGRPADRRSRTVAWFDNIAIIPGLAAGR